MQMKKQMLWLAALAALGGSVQAQDIYGGLGLPGLYTLGYAHPMGASWGLRGEYAGGLSWSGSGTDNGVSYDGSIKANRAGLFADWYPFNNGGFRLVGGITANDMKFDVNALGTGNATINNKTVNMAGHYFNMNLKYPTATPYLGIGYGHQMTAKGLGFYADLGVTFGSFSADVSTDLVGVSGVTQADVDAQKQKMNDSLGGLKYLPSISAGLVYRY
jgi:hypothetical protein